MTANDVLEQLGYSRNEEHWITEDKTDEVTSPLWRALESESKQHPDEIEVCGSYVFRTSPTEKDGRSLLPPRPAVHVVKANDEKQAETIRRKLWNLGTAPFLIVILPSRVLVYRGFDYDEKKTNGDHFAQALSSQEISQHLRDFYASEIDSGAIWSQQSKNLTPEKRVDQRLLKNLKHLGRELKDKYHLDSGVAHALIGKFIYIWYLRERNILSDEWLVGEELKSWDVLTGQYASATDLQALIESLEERFNGKIFPLDFDKLGENKDLIVQFVAGVFDGNEAVSKQLALDFKIYDFSCIPVELLSSIYEQFLHAEGKGKDEGAVYTREFVADYLLCEVNSVKPLQEGMKILDPACGSGVFLVLSYRRLIELRLRKIGKNKLTPDELAEILKQSIFGVELIRDACYVTEFSLILMLLSYVDPPELHENKEFHFPDLHDNNIFEGDFFNDELGLFAQQKSFDWIVGNPSWEKLKSETASEKQPHAWKWMQNEKNKTHRPVGKYSLCEAFSWRVSEVLDDEGCTGLFIGSKSLFNETSFKYRKEFFSKFEIHRITNFSNLRYVLFAGRAKVPGATIIYKQSKLGSVKPLISHYGPFKVNQVSNNPSERRTNKKVWSLTICEDEVQSVEALDAESGQASVWKFAFWGNYRDKKSVDRFARLFNMSVEESGWSLHQGLKLVNGNKLTDSQKKKLYCADLEKLPRLDVEMVKGEFFLSTPVFALEPIPENERYIDEQAGKIGLKVSMAPHVFWSLSGASYSDLNFVLPKPQMALISLDRDSEHLRAASMYLNSSIGRYLTFFHSTRWGIDRDDFGPKEARSVPIPNLTREQVGELAQCHIELSNEQNSYLSSAQTSLFKEDVEIKRWQKATPAQEAEWRNQLDEKVEHILQVPDYLSIIAKDFMNVRYQFNDGNSNVPAAHPAKSEDLKVYAHFLVQILDDFARTHHRVTIAKDRNFIVCTVEITEEAEAIEPQVVEGDAKPEDAQLWEDLRQPFSQWVYVQRSLRIFEGKKIHIWKTPRLMDWTRTQALIDSDTIIAEVLNYGGGVPQ